MSTSYNPSIPTPTDAPAQDVGTMQTNAGSIGNWCGLFDHFGFGIANAGLHKQITFPNTNIPTTPTSPPVLFTKNDAGSVPQLLFYNSNNYAQYSASSGAGAPGSTYLPGGIILKWGSKPSGATGTSITFTFASLGLAAFPNNCFVAFAIGNNNSRIYFTGINSASQIVVNANTALGASDNFFWLAIGN